MEKSSRRDFLKQSGLVTASLTPGIPTLTSANKPNSRDEIKWDIKKWCRETQKDWKRWDTTRYLTKNRQYYFKDAKPSDRYALVLVNEEISEFLDGVLAFEILGYCQNEQTATNTVKFYDEANKIAAYIRL